ncbi:hypothetical protein SprV_1002861900 [Sparganum proliferum]
MVTQNSSPGSTVCADVDDKITKDKLPSSRLRGQECVQFRVEFVSRLGGTAHRRSEDIDKGGNFSIPERKTEVHQAIDDARGNQGSRPTMSFRMAKSGELGGGNEEEEEGGKEEEEEEEDEEELKGEVEMTGEGKE